MRTSWGFKVNDTIGRHYSEVLPPSMLDKHTFKIKESLLGKSFDFSEELAFPDGDSFHAFGSYLPIKNDAGEILAVTHFVTNISEMKNKEEELERLNESKNRLFSVIAHDLRKPLNLLNGFVFISQQEDTTKEEQEQNLEMIDMQMKSLREMMDNLLLWARNQMSGRPQMLRSHNILDLILQETNIYKPMVVSKKIEVAFSVPEGLSMQLDDMSLRMVIRNIYSNAIKFTPSKGQIKVGAVDHEDHVVISIKDNGMGMTEEVANQILSGEVVHSMEGTQGEKGSGIGLYLGIEMLREHGGDIEIVSKEGEGTSFCVSLPKHQVLSFVA